MKTIKVTTRKLIACDFDYEVSVPDDYVVPDIPGYQDTVYLLNEIYNNGLQGQSQDNNQTVEEIIIRCENLPTP